jgi:hypothetical protein
MSETIQEMEGRWTILMAARNPQTGKRLYETEAAYHRECEVLRMEIAKQKPPEDRPRISAEQLRQINEQSRWLEQYKGTRTADGRQLYFDVSQEASAFRSKIDKAQKMLAAGTPIDPAWITDAEARITRHKATLGAPLPDQSAVINARAANRVGLLLPPSGATHIGGGSAQATPSSTMPV